MNTVKLNENFKLKCREIAADGTVLLKNDNDIFPINSGSKIALFGRGQFEYLKSGTGSGGRVHTEYTVNIYDGIKSTTDFIIDENISSEYLKFIESIAFNSGNGWATEPWMQPELDFPENIIKSSAASCETAIFVISRLGGEAQDLKRENYYLQQEELSTLKKMRKYYKKVGVLFNIGNIIDMKFINEIGIDGAMLISFGGQEGGNAVADVLSGRYTPAGKLADTVALNLSDYPSFDIFGNEDENYYTLDIYVGYKYFETFCPQKVLYPFGYGLSYTDFDISYSWEIKGENIEITANVKNIGSAMGRETVQIYYSAPQGIIGNPKKQLIAYEKTDVLNPGDSQTLNFSVNINDMASFDDSGILGHKDSFVLLNGEYEILAGTNVRNAKKLVAYPVNELKVIKTVKEALYPVKSYKRLKAECNNGTFKEAFEDTPTRQISPIERRKSEVLPEIGFKGDKNIKFTDIVEKKNTVDEFISQFSDTELVKIVFGEGMNCPKVKSGCGGAFGGLTEKLHEYGVPIACVTDGPSGLRFDTGEVATSMPCGTLIAQTFDKKLSQELFEFEGEECAAYGVDGLLGPGMNIHRHPFGGRNFEYFSEDPYLTGTMAVSQAKGLKKHNVSATIKHFACNSNELGRNRSDSIVSARALRECYLKGFEIAVKSGYCDMIMTSYNQINGIHTNSSYDLLKIILRDEWGYDGIVMTDWWPFFNTDNDEDDPYRKSNMIHAVNDLSMCVDSAEAHDVVGNGNAPWDKTGDDINQCIRSGDIKRYEIERIARHILNYLTYSNAYKRNLENPAFFGYGLLNNLDDLKCVSAYENVNTGDVLSPEYDNKKPLVIRLTVKSDKSTDTQTAVKIYNSSNTANTVFMVNGLNGNTDVICKEALLAANEKTIRFTFNPDEVSVVKIEILQ